MKNSIFYRISAALVLTLAMFAAQNVSAQTTEFTYQGSLQNGGVAAAGNYDFEFLLFDALSGGSQIGATIPQNGVPVGNGIFSVKLDFGAGFPGANRFLEIHVRPSGGGAFTPLTPRQPVTSTPYSLKSLSADTATNATTAGTATNATNAVNFSGALSGDVTGTQVSTVVTRLQGRDVSNTAPLGGQVLKFNNTTNQWVPDTDIVGTGGGGGTITGVTPGTGLSGGGATGNVTIGIAAGGVSTTQLADGGVTDAKIISVSGGKVTGTVASAANAINAQTANALSAACVGCVLNAQIGSVDGSKVTGTVANSTNSTNAATATNALSLGGVAASGYLQTTGNGSGLTSLNAASITTGTLNNARLGQIPTANIADSAVTAPKIASGQVVKSLNMLKDDVTLAAGSNITITPAGNTLTIASTGGGNAILNQTTQQAGANFNISGNGTAGGTLSGDIVNAATQYNIGGSRVLSIEGISNIFAGVNAGTANITGNSNSFFGVVAGQNNTDGFGNSFFGVAAGRNNMNGDGNSFFGRSAGQSNTGNYNSFFGDMAGSNNMGGFTNSFFGRNAGGANSTGSENTVIGTEANFGTSNLINATAIGAKALVTQSNSLVLGSINGVNNASTSTNVGIGITAPTSTLHVISTKNTAGDNTATFQATNIGPNQSHIHFGINGNWFIRSAASAGRVVLQDTGGNVGIGTATPNSKLQVTGGSIYVSSPNSLIITSPNGACWFITVGNTGALSTISVTCP